jgi:hypothetical protein
MLTSQELCSGCLSRLVAGVTSEPVTVSVRTCNRSIVRSSIDTDFRFVLPTASLPTTNLPMANAPRANAPTARAPKALAPTAAQPIVNCRRLCVCVIASSHCPPNGHPVNTQSGNRLAILQVLTITILWELWVSRKRESRFVHNYGLCQELCSQAPRPILQR